MNTPRIGQILKEMGVLSDQDIREALEHQRRTGQKFGQIAVSWALAGPEQIWEAWCRQLAEREELVDLDEVGVDTRAAAKLDCEYAMRKQVLPLRLWGSHMVVALGGPDVVEIVGELSEMTGCRIHYCLADRRQLDEHLAHAYASLCV